MAELRRWRTELTAFEAVIFDMDGVLVDGEPLHFEAVNQLLAQEGHSLSLDQYRPYMGTRSGWDELARDFGLDRRQGELHDRYSRLILESYRLRSTAMPGALPLVRALRERGVPMAVASSSVRPWVEACLGALGIGDAFAAILTGSDVSVGKPDPEIYLAAASALGVAPQACLAFEDAPAGIVSATAAGMTVWAVRTGYTKGLVLPGSPREFATLESVTLESITGVAA